MFQGRKPKLIEKEAKNCFTRRCSRPRQSLLHAGMQKAISITIAAKGALLQKHKLQFPQQEFLKKIPQVMFHSWKDWLYNFIIA